jgi:hypothetical protein
MDYTPFTNVKSAIEDGTVRILLDDKERTFSNALEEWFPVDADGRQYNMSSTPLLVAEEKQ